MAVDDVPPSSPTDPLLLLPRRQGTKSRAARLAKLVAKWSLKVAMWALFVGWIFMFFYVPTGAGADWYSVWQDIIEVSFFGITGASVLLYTGPILLIAVLAVPYLLISGDEEEELQEKKKPGFRLKTFPVLVDGIFGVVTAAELIGIALFVAFVVWAVYSYTLVNIAQLPSFGDLTPTEKKVQMLQLTAYTLGLTGLTCLAFLFLPVARGSILLRLIDVPFEHAARYHVWLGHLTLSLFTLHGICYFSVWVCRGIVLKSIVEWKSTGGANLAGIITYMFGFSMWMTALPPVRKRNFELFYYTHQLYMLFVIFLALHIGDTNFSKVAGGIFLFMVDRFLRFWQSRKNVDIISATSFPCGSMSLVISKPPSLHYNALSFIFLRVRDVSWIQWHPFSVSSSPLDGRRHLSVLIKAVGDWTRKLRRNVSDIAVSQAEMSIEPSAGIVASVEGPYGHESPYHLTYKKLLLVAGGSGISPFLAILSDILHRIRDDKPCLPRNILIIWAIKRSSEISLLSTIDIDSLCPSSSEKVNVEIQIYVTQEFQPPLEGGNVDGVVSVNTRSRGGTMSVLVGTGSKMWSGTYVIVSILGFVITLGLVDLFIINPYSVTYWWKKSLLFMASMVVAMTIFGGSVIYLWHRSESATSAREEDREDSREYGVIFDREAARNKKFLHESTAVATSVFYGHRPDFKEIFGLLSDSWGSVDVGVIVCGPQALQSSVAKEIRSQDLQRKGDTPVFHFNSHSFDL